MGTCTIEPTEQPGQVVFVRGLGQQLAYEAIGEIRDEAASAGQSGGAEQIRALGLHEDLGDGGLYCPTRVRQRVEQVEHHLPARHVRRRASAPVSSSVTPESSRTQCMNRTHALRRCVRSDALHSDSRMVVISSDAFGVVSTLGQKVADLIDDRIGWHYFRGSWFVKGRDS